MCESFFATLECELIDRRRFRSHSEARMAVFQFIEGFYNPSRRHSALGYLSPVEYERKHDGLSKPAWPCLAYLSGTPANRNPSCRRSRWAR